MIILLLYVYVSLIVDMMGGTHIYIKLDTYTKKASKLIIFIRIIKIMENSFKAQYQSFDIC